MTIKELITAVSEEVKIKSARTFWDKDVLGVQPEEYLVWKVSGYNDRIDSDNENEIQERVIRVSLFSKNDDFEERAERIIEAVRRRGYKAYLLSFEDYEKETKYHHKEFEIIWR